ncbi:hypothetical protein ACQVM9_18970, partial [Bacillus pretiosus]
MCNFCLNKEKAKSKFKLFDIKPIPFFIPIKSFAYSSDSQESPHVSIETIKPQESPHVSTETIRP